MVYPLGVAASETHRAIEAVWRIESAKLIAGLARMVRDVGIAEELAQDALVAALKQWPESGVPDNPGAWLMATAKRRAIDLFRRRQMLVRKHDELGREIEVDQALNVPDLDAALDDDIGDDLLRLMFTACHPVLSAEARVALTLRLIAGLTTDEIARAFLVAEPTIAQRIVRAKRTLADQRIPFEMPGAADRAVRLSSVLEVLYLVFNEGYSATAGEDWMRPQLCEEAMRIGRILAGLAPEEAEVHGLVALMEIQASRFAARTGPSGEPVLLLDQDRGRWDRLLIGRGLAALARADALGARRTLCPPGRDRRLPRPRADGGSDGLVADCRALRGSRAHRPLTRGRTQPVRRRGDGRRTGRRPCIGRSAGRRAGPEGLPSPSRRARRPAGEARPRRRGPGRVRARRRTDAERPRARCTSRPRGRLRRRCGAGQFAVIGRFSGAIEVGGGVASPAEFTMVRSPIA